MSGGNSVVESLPSKQMVAGSSPVPRSIEQSFGVIKIHPQAVGWASRERGMAAMF
jgi:hypothetical protein